MSEQKYKTQSRFGSIYFSTSLIYTVVSMLLLVFIAVFKFKIPLSRLNPLTWYAEDQEYKKKYANMAAPDSLDIGGLGEDNRYVRGLPLNAIPQGYRYLRTDLRGYRIFAPNTANQPPNVAVENSGKWINEYLFGSRISLGAVRVVDNPTTLSTPTKIPIAIMITDNQEQRVAEATLTFQVVNHDSPDGNSSSSVHAYNLNKGIVILDVYPPSQEVAATLIIQAQTPDGKKTLPITINNSGLWARYDLNKPYLEGYNLRFE